MAYTYSLATAIGQVRLYIGDRDITPTTDAQFSDEELQVFLNQASQSVLLASAFALEAWAAVLVSSVMSERIGDYAYTKKEADNKLALAARYRAEVSALPASDWASLDQTGLVIP